MLPCCEGPRKNLIDAEKINHTQPCFSSALVRTSAACFLADDALHSSDSESTKVKPQKTQRHIQGQLLSNGVVSWKEHAFPIKVCAVCGEEFELKPDKPGFANHCPACSETENAGPATKGRMDAAECKNAKEANEARRQAMRDLLYRKDS